MRARESSIPSRHHRRQHECCTQAETRVGFEPVRLHERRFRALGFTQGGQCFTQIGPGWRQRRAQCDGPFEVSDRVVGASQFLERHAEAVQALGGIGNEGGGGFELGHREIGTFAPQLQEAQIVVHLEERRVDLQRAAIARLGLGILALPCIDQTEVVPDLGIVRPQREGTLVAFHRLQCVTELPQRGTEVTVGLRVVGRELHCPPIVRQRILHRAEF
jgi:hypothetical protein